MKYKAARESEYKPIKKSYWICSKGKKIISFNNLEDAKEYSRILLDKHKYKHLEIAVRIGTESRCTWL